MANLLHGKLVTWQIANWQSVPWQLCYIVKLLRGKVLALSYLKILMIKFILNDLKPGTTYNCRITVYNSDGESSAIDLHQTTLK